MFMINKGSVLKMLVLVSGLLISPSCRQDHDVAEARAQTVSADEPDTSSTTGCTTAFPGQRSFAVEKDLCLVEALDGGGDEISNNDKNSVKKMGEGLYLVPSPLFEILSHAGNEGKLKTLDKIVGPSGRESPEQKLAKKEYDRGRIDAERHQELKFRGGIASPDQRTRDQLP